MDWKDKKVLVFGSGKSGMGAAGLLSSLEACPIIFDSNEKVDRQAIEKKLCGRGQICLGHVPEEIMDALDLVVMSPGVPCDQPLVEEFRKRGIPVWGEVELAFRLGKGRVLAVTGTNGKTTTTAGRDYEGSLPGGVRGGKYRKPLYGRCAGAERRGGDRG